MKRLINAIRRVIKIAFCDHPIKVRIMTLKGNVDYKICKKCGLTQVEKD